MRIIRYAELAPAAWKNGAGITREACREPAGPAPFGWRLSFAQVDASGPFSDFSGYTRYLVLLRGAGVRLNFGAGRSTILREPGDLVRFDGGIATHGELLHGACIDLNLIAANRRYGVHAGVELVVDRFARAPLAAETVLMVPLGEAILVKDLDGESARLGPWDLAVGRLHAAIAAVPCRVFVAGIVDNSPD